MAITPFDIACNKQPKALCSTIGGKPLCRFVKINFASDSSGSSSSNKSVQPRSASKSPYLVKDSVQISSRITEKRLVHKNNDFPSSFPLAANIYKANSDELNSLRRANKKVKKSVLTLPNDQAPLPQVCTVSDVNDSEYHNPKNEARQCKVKKRLPNSKKTCGRNKQFEFYDRDARFCSQFNIDLDCSSTDVINYNGDSNKLTNSKQPSKLKEGDEKFQGHDVWAVLRNINRFQFQPSPPMSVESVKSPKKKKGQKRRNCKDTRFIETCHTEEIAYISSYELEEKSTFSQSSSIDRITVIDKKDEYSHMCEFEERIVTTRDLFQNKQNLKRRNLTNNKNITRNSKNNAKFLGNNTSKERNNRTLVLNNNDPRLKSAKKVIGDQDNCRKFDESDVTSCTSKPNTVSTVPVRNYDSGSSKAALKEAANISKAKKSLLKVSSDESAPRFKGISKVILSKGWEKPELKVNEFQREPPMRKPRLDSSVPNSLAVPKLAPTEMNRRLANIKFPVVILNNQAKSTLEADYNSPTLNGAVKTISPLMLKHSEDNKRMKRESSPTSNNKCSDLEANRRGTPNTFKPNAMKLGKKTAEANVNKELNTINQQVRAENQKSNEIKGFANEKRRRHSPILETTMKSRKNCLEINNNHIQCKDKKLVNTEPEINNETKYVDTDRRCLVESSSTKPRRNNIQIINKQLNQRNKNHGLTECDKYFKSKGDGNEEHRRCSPILETSPNISRKYHPEMDTSLKKTRRQEVKTPVNAETCIKYSSNILGFKLHKQYKETAEINGNAQLNYRHKKNAFTEPDNNIQSNPTVIDKSKRFSPQIMTVNICNPRSNKPINCKDTKKRNDFAMTRQEVNGKRYLCTDFGPNGLYVPTIILDTNLSGPRKNRTEINPNKQKDKKDNHLVVELLKNPTKAEDKVPIPTPFSAISSKFQQYKKQKPILQLKERMLNLLYKKNIVKDITKESRVVEPKRAVSPDNKSQVNVGTDIQAAYINRIPTDSIRRSTSPVKTPLTITRPQNNIKQRWARANWASDFIENVIKKIKNGVYYTQHSNISNRRQKNPLFKEISVQTTQKMRKIYDHSYDLTPEKLNEQDPLRLISEFDNSLSAIEIKTFNRNQIAIKHCITNVMVQFDVSIPTESSQIMMNSKTSLSVIPLEVTDSHTKIFKSKTTIVNSVLPAELCSILPRMMTNLIDSRVKSVQTLLPLSLPKILIKPESQLTPISDLTRIDLPDRLKGCEISLFIPPEIKRFHGGRFPKRMIQQATDKIVPKINYNCKLLPTTLCKISLKYLLPLENSQSINIPRTIRNGMQYVKSSKELTKVSQTKTSTALIPYIASNHSLVPTFERYDLTGMIDKLMQYRGFQIFFNSMPRINELRVQYDGENDKVNVAMKNTKGLDQNIALTVNRLQLSSFFNAKIMNRNAVDIIDSDFNLNEVKCVEDVHICTPAKNMESKDSKDRLIVATNRGKRKGFFKLYRKCKSATNIPSGAKCCNINKIANLEDFFEVLGSKLWMTSMFDGYMATKILSCVMEMKNWISDINPRQAMLVLLLTNKKDTPNLVRFRPLILQGIAVNRITKATELDIEIEVIEKEYFYKIYQHEGISYVPVSAENNENLFQELCWIAKTTASDFQRPFDDSSEKLLKSLLEKRKKLNPSYLRVMARYVGLGILKASVKK